MAETATVTVPTEQGNARPLRRVTKATLLQGLTVRLCFDDGVVKAINFKPFLTGPVFAPLRDSPALFRELSVDPELGVVVWPNGADLDAQVLYYDDLFPESWVSEGLTPEQAAARKRSAIVG